MSTNQDQVTQISEPTSPSLAGAPALPGAGGIRDSLRGKYVCPFCGSVNDSEQGTCPRCTMENSAATRKATKTRIGPWYVLQTRNPAAPGMTWETLVGFIRKGRVKPRSIVRGPTTHQLWRFAAHVKGLSREFGICYSCGTAIETVATLCPTCNRLQDPPPNPDALLEASREGQQSFATPPATVDGTILAAALGPTTVTPATPGIDGTVTLPLTAQPQDAEFVIPALGAGMSSASAPAASVTPGTSLSGGTPGLGGVSASGFQGISGDASWAKIGATPRERAQPPERGPAAPRPMPKRQGVNGSAAGNKFNPYADEDLPPTAANRRNDGEGFLSAKDLAAAFNLSFVGEEDDEAPSGQTARPAPAGRNGAAKSAATAARVPAQPSGPSTTPIARENPPGAIGAMPAVSMAAFGPPARPGKSKFKIFIALLFLAAAGFGVALAVSDDLRRMTKTWFMDLTASLNKQTDSDQLGSPGSNRKKLDPKEKADPKKSQDQQGRSTPDGQTGALRQDGGDGDAQMAAVSATKPVLSTSPPNLSPPASSPATPASLPTDPITPPASSTSAPTPPSGASWYDSESSRLYKEALSLEVSDPALALAKYKDIKRLPRTTWPSDLDDRIKRTEARLKKMFSPSGSATPTQVGSHKPIA